MSLLFWTVLTVLGCFWLFCFFFLLFWVFWAPPHPDHFFTSSFRSSHNSVRALCDGPETPTERTFERTDGPTNGRTNQRTDQPTDGPTNELRQVLEMLYASKKRRVSKKSWLNNKWLGQSGRVCNRITRAPSIGLSPIWPNVTWILFTTKATNH